MADEVHTEAQGELAEPQEKLDPETRARRAAALTLVRKYGDPVLRSQALEIDRFDDALIEEVRRMGRLMHDAYGIGLAATLTSIGLALVAGRGALERRVGGRAWRWLPIASASVLGILGLIVTLRGLRSW